MMLKSERNTLEWVMDGSQSFFYNISQFLRFFLFFERPVSYSAH
jgi:hypothetical protein